MALTQEQVDELAEKLDELDLEKAMSYSLADAIREGCTTTGQCIGNWDDEEGNVCALSAALLAVKARKLLL